MQSNHSSNSSNSKTKQDTNYLKIKIIKRKP